MPVSPISMGNLKVLLATLVACAESTAVKALDMDVEFEVNIDGEQRETTLRELILPFGAKTSPKQSSTEPTYYTKLYDDDGSFKAYAALLPHSTEICFPDALTGPGLVEVSNLELAERALTALVPSPDA